jgi:predicted negative regulator of RcsB-dependent stress response
MAKKKVTRKELLKETDEFLSFSSRAVIFIREHSRQFSYAGAFIASILLMYVGINTYMKYINKKAQDAYNTAYYAFAENLKPESDQKDLKQAEESFKKIIDEYGRSDVSRMALPQLAYLKFLQEKYDEAIPLYEEFLTKASENTPYQSLARMALAVCYEDKGEFQRAIETLKQITDGPDDFLKEQSLLSQARAYRLANQRQKSKEILEEFVEKFKLSPSLPSAKAHLNELP